MSVALESLTATYIVDVRNIPTPGPLMEIKVSMALVDAGKILELRATEQGAREDFPAWARKSGDRYLGVVARDGYDSHFIQKQYRDRVNLRAAPDGGARL